jgi:hypothetical protein
VALFCFAVASWEGALAARQAALPSALIALCVVPALYGTLQALRRHGSARRAQQRREALAEQIAQAERELAQLWDEFRLLADRFARAAVSFEEGLPAGVPLFAPGAGASGRAPGGAALLQLRAGEGIPGVATDEQLFPPELAPQLQLAPAAPRAALYRVTESGPAGVRAARWATYFPPTG